MNLCCRVGVRPIHGRMLSSNPGPCPLDASSTPSHMLPQPKTHPDSAKRGLWGETHTQMLPQRTTQKFKAQLCLTLCDPMDCSSPGSSVHGIFPARILEWVIISFSRASSWPRDQTRVSRTAGRLFTIWATRETPGNHWSDLYSEEIKGTDLEGHPSPIY